MSTHWPRLSLRTTRSITKNSRLKEPLAQAGKEQAASAAKAKIEGAEEMFLRMAGAGEWFMLASKVKMVEEEKAQTATS